MRPLRRHLYCTPVFALAHILFPLLSFSLLSPVYSKDSHQLRRDGCRESCGRVNCSISARLKPVDRVACNSGCQSPEASFKTYGTSLVSTANQLRATSPVAERWSVEQPIGTHTLWNEPWLAENCLSSLPKAWSQSHGEVQKSIVLSDHLNYNMLKGYCGIFAQWHQK